MLSVLEYIAFPREVASSPLVYIKHEEDDEFCIKVDEGERLRDDITSAFFIAQNSSIFNNCFRNSFIYEFYVGIPGYYRKRQIEITKTYREKEVITGCLDYESMKRDLEKYWNLDRILLNQTLYKFLHDILKVGEFVEIYEAWMGQEDERGVIFGPPTSETVISLEDLLTFPRPTKKHKREERTKLTIHKIS